MNQYFARVSGYPDAVIPERKTKGSAGYDLCAYRNGKIEPGATVLVETGIKCKMRSETLLQVHLRSSIGIENYVMLANGTGIIDADYFDNKDNEGHIHIPIFNYGEEPFYYSAGERIAQGIFLEYGKVDGDMTVAERTGGFGSTGKE